MSLNDRSYFCLNEWKCGVLMCGLLSAGRWCWRLC